MTPILIYSESLCFNNDLGIIIENIQLLKCILFDMFENSKNIFADKNNKKLIFQEKFISW